MHDLIEKLHNVNLVVIAVEEPGFEAGFSVRADEVDISKNGNLHLGDADNEIDLVNIYDYALDVINGQYMLNNGFRRIVLQFI